MWRDVARPGRNTNLAAREHRSGALRARNRLALVETEAGHRLLSAAAQILFRREIEVNLVMCGIGKTARTRFRWSAASDHEEAFKPRRIG